MERVRTEFDIELQLERERWLRRRLLWLCAIGTALTLLFDVRTTRLQLQQPNQQAAGWVSLIECTLVVFLYLSGWLYARWHELPERSLLRLVFWLVILVAAVEVVCRRIETSFLSLADPTQLAAEYVAVTSSGVVLAVLVFDHLLACIFMPWTARESLPPAFMMVAMYASSLLWDYAHAALPSIALVTIPALAVCFIPGTLICVWRNSAFRNTFQLRFESSRYRQLQNELASARRLQEASLPKPKKDGPIRLHYAYEPMRQIGGDLLFLHTLENSPQKASIVVLDVTGHGIAAAITVNRMIGELERLYAECPAAAPDAILKALNRYVALTLARHDIYATALCVKLNTETGDLTWASAGHPPAFLHRVDGTQEPLGATAPLLGVDDSEQYFEPAGHLKINPGDVLLAYTDGVCEAVNSRGDQLGIDGVKRLISERCAGQCDPNAWPDRMLEEVLNYRQSPVDDDTLVVTVFGAA